MRGDRHVNVVVIGTFNPSIFQPEWFKSQEILPASEVDAAIERPGGVVVTSDTALITFKSLLLNAFQARWLLATDRPDWEGDLGTIVSSVFGLLPHTPVTTVGFNVNATCPVSASTLKVAMDRWVPLVQLGQLAGDRPRVSGVARGAWGRYQVMLRVEESSKQPGSLEIQQNFERPLTGGVRELRELLITDWQAILSRAKEIADRLCNPEVDRAATS